VKQIYSRIQYYPLNTFGVKTLAEPNRGIKFVLNIYYARYSAGSTYFEYFKSLKRMRILLIWLIAGSLFGIRLAAQDNVISRKQFFTDTAMVVVTLQTDMKKLYGQKKNPAYQPAKITWHQADSTGDVSANIKVRLRGNYRRENCGIASLMVEFRDSTNQSKLRNLKNLKMVAPCGKGYDKEQLVIKEFLVYKIYNQLTEKSFRVRPMSITFEDVNNKFGTSRQYAFVIEPIDDLAKRNGCVEEDEKKILTEQTDRAQTTLVNMFQYMIANTDWSIPLYHNIKLIEPKEPPYNAPYVIPYDFDYCGLVNAPYAIPHESTGLLSVTERLYMGFPRTLEEIKAAAAIFISKKEAIFNLIQSNPMLTSTGKREMLNFLEEYYSLLASDAQLNAEFIRNARKK
jgi:hypothetical protein